MGRRSGLLLNLARPPRARRATEQRRNGLRAALGLLAMVAVPLRAAGRARVVAPVPAAAPGPANALPSALLPGLFHALGGRSVLAQQGALYLADNPLERNPTLLLQRLALDIASPRESLRAAVAHDWRRHDVVALDGWVLARSEARICALAYLSAPA